MSPKLRSTTRKLDTSPDLLSLASYGESVTWLTEATSLIALGPFLRIDPGTGAQRFERGSSMFHQLLEGAQIHDEVDVPGTGPVLFASWTFDQRDGGSSLVVPSTVYGSGEGAAWRTELEWDGNTASAPRAGAAPGIDSTPEQWMATVQDARRDIASGTLEKVVLARQVTVTGAGHFDQAAITRLLRASYPGCFTYRFESLIGASPELLIRRVGDVVDSIPLAGSAPRGVTDSEDETLGRGLTESAKNRREHALTVASVLERLFPYCSELVAEPEPSLLLLANLQHLSTKVQGRLRGGADALQLAGAVHPTAAVCGVPQPEALEFIRGAEHFERGRYAGPIGWMDHHGDGEWALALRCALIGETTARVYAGAGILADSDPEEELEETRLKLQAMLNVLEP